MIRTYICSVCMGTGQIWSVDYGEGGELREPCSYCVARGTPPKVELKMSGPPAAREFTIDVEYTPVGTPILKDGE